MARHGVRGAGNELLDVVVIGAGQAGLAMAWHLAARRRAVLRLCASVAILWAWATPSEKRDSQEADMDDRYALAIIAPELVS